MILANILATGFQGEPLPYSPRLDDSLTLGILVVFLLYAFVGARCRKYLTYQTRNFFTNRNRNSFFSDVAVIDRRHLLTLFILSATTLAMVLYNYAMQVLMPHVTVLRPGWQLGALAGGIALGLGLKLLLYQLTGYIFFDRARLSAWIDAYLLVVFYWGIVLFPGLLLLVFTDLTPDAGLYMFAFLLVSTKILLFYKWFKLFFNNHDRLLLLILYFCALEIIPLFLLYKGIMDSMVVFQ